MYAVHREIHPPTGIELSVYCNFFNNSETNLVVAGTHVLKVFKIKQDISSKSTDKPPADAVRKWKLECKATFDLFGCIVSLQSVHLAGAARDSLLISFQDAKLSVVEYDAENHDLKTLSLHYFEDDDLKGGFAEHACNPPVLRVDPEGRCAAMLIYGTQLVILPFKRDTASEFSDTGEGRLAIQASYIIDLKGLDEKIINVLDIQFMHGYYEPSLFILYEPLPTWSGRIAVRKDSCSIVAISLNLQEKVHPTIWSLNALPFDCKQAVPVPKPIGGVLVFAVNSLLYLNQSFPPYGVSLNSITDYSTDFLLKTQEGMKLTMDCSQATFISFDKVVISLKGGELYVLTLLSDTMRAVKGFHLDKAAASVLTTCMTMCGEGFLFLGSRLGNSLLLKYTEKTETANVNISDSGEPAAKKQKKDTITDWMAGDVAAVDDLDLEVYGSDTQREVGSHITQYAFQVCDSITNIGPCGQCVMGEPAFLSEEFSNCIDPDLELVTTSGYSKNGAISVLQRSIRPQVVTTFELPGCADMWTVVAKIDEADKRKESVTDIAEEKSVDTEEEGAEGGSKQKEKKKKGEGDGTEEDEEEDEEDKEDPQDNIENGHAFLILGRDDNTMVLQTGKEIMELDQSGFQTQEPTMFAGNIGNNEYIIQVTKTSIRLIKGVKEITTINLELDSPICSCSVADPYVMILTEAGYLVVLMFEEHETWGARLISVTPEVQQDLRVLAATAYKDVSGLFNVESEDRLYGDVVEKPPKKDEPAPMETSSSLFNLSNVDEEDDLLYGDSDLPATSSVSDNRGVSQEKQTEVGSGSENGDGAASCGEEVTPTYWAVVAKENGYLEIYSLPEFTLMFAAVNFPFGHGVLTDIGASEQTFPSTSSQKTGSADKPSSNVDMPVVKELLLLGLGEASQRPYLLARVGEELLMYEVFEYMSSPIEHHLRIRFKRFNHGLIVKEKKLTKVARSKKAEIDLEVQELRVDKIRWLRPFTDISGYSGVFLCGPYPHWIIMTSRGTLRLHPMGIDGTITCFAPFHNINCPKGFLYFNKKGEMRICVLPTHLSYDAPWPVRKVPVRCTPHFTAYHTDSKTYSVVTSITDVNKRLVEVIGDGEKEFKDAERGERFIWPTLEKFGIQLFSPISWEPIPNTRLELGEFEVVTCIKQVNLTSEGTLSGLKGFVAVGTNYNYHEDVPARGRLIIYDVIEVVPEPGQPLTKNKMKIEYDKDQKGPISALDHVEGYLVTAIGQKVYVWQYKDQDLQGLAFIDTQIYIHQISVIKNMILIADICKSVSLLRFQQGVKVLSLVSRDIKPLEVYSVAYLVDNTSLSFLVSDKDKNLQVYTYQPEVRESHGGQRLLRRADYHLGHHINTFFRLRCRLSDPSTHKAAIGPIQKRHVTYFATLDGSIDYLLPLTEKMYRRLLNVQMALTVQLPHLAGLNPRFYRTIKHGTRELNHIHRNILDGALLWKYLTLPLNERLELAKRIGTTNDQLIDDLMEIDRTAAHF